jgi:hypothetical protein
MADDYNISYSYQTGTPQPAAPPASQPSPSSETDLIAFTNCERVDMGNGGVLLMNRDNGKQIIVAPEVATALTYCTTFKRLQEHAQTLVNTIPQLQGQLTDVTNVLNMVNDAGLMLQAQSICDRLEPESAPVAELAPTRVCIITCDRPAAVQRLLDSMLKAGNLSRHDELFLVDDSREEANSEQNRELVANFNLTSPKNMRYVGAAAQQTLLDGLIQAHPDQQEAIRFLIDRQRWSELKSYGLARTVCLLLSVGYRCIVLDDDVLCFNVAPPIKQSGLTFDGGDGRELACYASEQALYQNAAYNDIDPLTGHARCLGMNLAQALTQLATRVDQGTLQNANAALLNTLEADSPILVTQCGSWGDPGTANSHWFYHLGEDSIKRLLAAPGGLAGAMSNRHYWLGRSRPNIGKMALMSQVTGLDNAQLLPPYFPVFRSEDSLFASMVLWLHPKSAVLDYDWCVPHLPLEQRTGSKTDDPMAAQGGLGLCARYLSNRVDYEAGLTGSTRLQKLALQLKELSEYTPTSLRATFRTELAQEHANQLRQLNQQLQRASTHESQEWETYLNDGVGDVTENLQTPASSGNITDAPTNMTEDSLIHEVKQGIAAFSNALLAWPDMRNSAAIITNRLIASGNLTP